MTGHSPQTDSQATTLKLCKLAVEMADRVSARRAATNTFFLTVYAALAGIVGIVSTGHRISAGQADKFGLITLAIVGIVMSFTWWMLLRYYRRLNSAKFKVIINIEGSFSTHIFEDEWGILHPTLSTPPPTGRLRRWASKNSHREASVVEQSIPWVFAAIYIAAGVRVLVS